MTVTTFPSNQLIDLLVSIQVINRRVAREEMSSHSANFKVMVEGAVLRAIRTTIETAKPSGVPPTIFVPPMNGGAKKELTFQFVENLLIELTRIIGPVPSHMEDQVQLALCHELSAIDACENVTEGMYMFSYRNARSGVVIHVPLSATANSVQPFLPPPPKGKIIMAQQPTPVLLFGGFPSDRLLAQLTKVQLENKKIIEDDGSLGDLQHRSQLDFRAKIVKTILTAAIATLKEAGTKGLNFLILSDSNNKAFTAEFIAQLTKEFEAVTGKLPDENKKKIMELLYQELCSVGEQRNEEVLLRYSDKQCMARACYDPPLTPTATE